MKINIQLIKISLFVTIISLLCGCSDDFLKKDYWKPVKTFQATAKYPLDISGLQEISFPIEVSDNASFSVVTYPAWMNPVQLKGTTSNNKITLSYYANSSWGFTPTSSFTFCFEVSGLGQIEILTEFRPNIDITPESIDFGKEGDSETVVFVNKENRNIGLSIEYCPEWLQLYSNQNLSIAPNSSAELQFFCDRLKLSKGTHTDHIVFKTNTSEVFRVKVTVEIDEFVSKDLFAIEGSVKGAAFNKQKGIMYVVTQSPNRMIIYNTANDSKQEVILPKAPKCITLSESGDQAFIGHSGLLSVINTTSGEITSSIEVDFNIFDLAYGENDWCYVSLDDSYGHEIFGINIKSKQAIVLTNYGSNFGGQTHLTKIKGKALLIGSRVSVSPSGVILADISNPTEIKEKYWHESYGRLWLSEDQNYTYSASGQIFKTPNMNTAELYILHSIKKDEYSWSNFNWIESSGISNKIWTTSVYSYWDKDATIKKYETTDYTLEETISPSPSQATGNGTSDIYATIAHFVFSDKSGENLYIIKNKITDNTEEEHNLWSVQKINSKKQ